MTVIMAHSKREVGVTARHGQACATIAIVLALGCATLSLQTGVHAQTIDPRDTRTFQDNRVQDTRQNPVPVPPDEAARLKRLTEEAAAPEPSDPRREGGEKKKSESESSERSPSPTRPR